MAMGPFHLEEAVCCPFSKIAAAGIGCIFRMQEGLGAELARFLRPASVLLSSKTGLQSGQRE